MNETVTKYVVVDAATGEDLCAYDNQAPATTRAKRYSRARWKGDTETRITVEARTYALVSKQTVRTLEDGKRV